MEKQIQKAPDEIQFNSEMKQKLPTNANTARIPLLFGNYFWEMLVEETSVATLRSTQIRSTYFSGQKSCTKVYRSYEITCNIFLLFSLHATYPKKCLKNALQTGQTASRIKNILL